MKKNEAISILATSVRPREQKDRARYDEAVKIAIDALNEPERKTGKWIHQTKFGRIECDQCGKVYRNAFTPKNYCPNCGARLI